MRITLFSCLLLGSIGCAMKTGQSVQGGIEQAEPLTKPLASTSGLENLVGTVGFGFRNGDVVAIICEGWQNIDGMATKLPILYGVNLGQFAYTDITDKGLSRLIKKMPDLEIIDLRGCQFITAASAQVLADCGSLKSVHLDLHHLATEDARAALAIWQRSLGARLQTSNVPGVRSINVTWDWKPQYIVDQLRVQGKKR